MRTAVIALVLVTMGVLPAMAQTENFQIYFDDVYTQAAADCPGMGVLDTLYVVANNFNIFISAAELAVQLPPQLVWIADLPNTPLAIGNTQSGVAYSWSLPQSGFGPFEVTRLLVSWNCNDCVGAQNGPVIVMPHPVTLNNGMPRVARFPDNALVDGVGMTSLVCATVPVEETSWGKLKALYDID